MNPLANALVAPLANRHDPVLYCADGSEVLGNDLHDLTGKIANVLAHANVGPGDRVAVQTQKSVEALALYLACLRLGALFLPLNTAYTIAEIEYFLGDADPRAVICDPTSEDALKEHAANGNSAIFTLDSAGNGSLADAATHAEIHFVDVDRNGDDLAAILYTSGTTGRSKGAMLSQDNLLSNAKSLVQTWQFTANDTLLHALPIFHVHGLFVAINVSLLAGGRMIFLPRFDVDVILSSIGKATTMMGVPTFYTRLLSEPLFTQNLTHHMRLFISGSAPLLADTHREFKSRTGHQILERYGMTETTMSTSNPYVGERRAGTVGFPLPGVELRIADAETGDVKPKGQPGILEVRGPNVFKGYWRMPEKTADEFRTDGFFITGDIAQIDDAGYVSIVGRAKDLIISGGYNVYPKEVETEIDALEGVVESAVIGAPHPDFGEAVIAVVTRIGDIDNATIIQSLQSRLAKFKCPKEVFFLEELPRNAMGKVQKNALRKMYAETFTEH